MENCLDQLLANSPREYSGSSTSNSYDYQKDWGILLLLNCHKQMIDYLIFFDYHEDIIKFNSNDDPKSGIFYQVKTKSNGNWTVKSLLKTTKVKDRSQGLSILGKMLTNQKIFNNDDNQFVFVTNASFSIDLKNGESSFKKDKICLNEIEEKEKLDLIESISKEIPEINLECLNRVFLIKTEQPIDGHDKYIKGALADYFDEIQAKNGVGISLVYRSIFDEIKRRSNYRFQVYSREEIEKKSISKNYFNHILDTFRLKTDYLDIFKRIEVQLSNEHVPFSRIKALRDAIKTIEAKIMDSTDKYIEDLIKNIKDYLETNNAGDNLNINADLFYQYLIKVKPEYMFVPREEIESLYMVKLYE